MAGEPIIDTSSAYDLDYSTRDVAKAWQTQRLRMIRVDETDPRTQQAFRSMQQDPVLTALASTAALQPVGRRDLEGAFAAMAGALLSVSIALLPEEAAAADATAAAAAAADAGATADDVVIIGNMTIGWGGLSPRTLHHRNASMGISLLREHQGRGYGAEAIRWMLGWAFGHMGLHTVSLTAAAFNQRAVRLYKRLGFRVEGRRKETVYFNRGWHDEIDFGMTEHEWDALREKELN